MRTRIPQVPSPVWVRFSSSFTELNRKYEGQHGYQHGQGEWKTFKNRLIRVDETIDIPVRHSIISHSPSTIPSMPDFIAPNPIEGGWVLNQLPGTSNKHGKYNHPSGAIYQHLVIQAGENSGARLGGAQTTAIDGMCVWGHGPYGVYLLPSSHTFRIQDLWTMGAIWRPKKPRLYEGTGLTIHSSHAIPLTNVKLHRAALGLRIINSGEVTMSGIDIEHCTTAIKAEGAYLLRGTARIHHCGQIPIDLKDVRECDFAVQLSWPLTPGPQWYRNRRGKLGVIHPDLTRKGNGVFVRFLCNRSTDYQVHLEYL